MTWLQPSAPIDGSILWSALAALAPILYFFWALAIKRRKGYIAGSTTLLVALLVAVFFYRMPAGMAVMSAIQGAVYGMLPIGWIILASVFLYKLTVKSGQFEVIRTSVISITEDRRLQALLVAFSFGAFLEGAAGFGAPVAISAALLVGLGFHPLYAAGICLLANTAPVAFGAIGVPITCMEGPTGIAAVEISKMVGRQMLFISVIIPLYLVFVMAGWKKTREVLPAILVSGISFAVTQFLCANFLGPELPGVLSGLVSLFVLAVFLRFWQPKTIFRFASEKTVSETASAHLAPRRGITLTPAQIVKAWSPFLVLTIFISLWGIPQIKAALTGHYDGYNAVLAAVNGLGQHLTFTPPVPWLHNLIIGGSGQPIAAVFKLELLSAAGTAILLAAVVTKFILKISWHDWFLTFGETGKELTYPLVTIMSVVAFAYVANASGMSTTLGLLLAKTGLLFRFFSPVLGWLGVLITGSDTSSNLLFANLQKITATSIGMNPLLALAANSSGGVTGKMISPQSIAVACAAVGLVGKESDLLRFTIKHSIFLLVLVAIITFLQSNLLAWMVP